MRNKIYEMAAACREFAEKEVKVEQSKIFITNYGEVGHDYKVAGDIKGFERRLTDLYNDIKDKYPTIARNLKEQMEEYDNNRVVHFSEINAIVKCIMAIEESPATKKKIFISHSSKDKVIVSNFVDHILMLGIGLNAEDIFCTSIEEMAIRNGEDIRKHIQGNIRTADFSLLLISNNYKESEICINEMGAVWAYDTNVRLYMLPNTTFDKIGWLCETRKADKINEAMTLDSFYTELCEYYSFSVNYPSWSRQRQTFLNLLAQKEN